MKISSKMLHIPPYISTSWKNIASLQTEADGPLFTLIISLNNGSRVEIPHMTQNLLNTIFTAHMSHIEEENKLQGIPFNLSIPIPKIDSALLEPGLDNPLQHNPDQANLPPLPEEVLKKVAMTAKLFGLDTSANLPAFEPECHCLYCQIMRALKGDITTGSALLEEPVSEADLTFRTWDIEEIGKDLYKVSNPLDPAETYQVFLGTPIGCTCGHNNCEHIKSILNT
jgi:hypothetical protein